MSSFWVSSFYFLDFPYSFGLLLKGDLDFAFLFLFFELMIVVKFLRKHTITAIDVITLTFVAFTDGTSLKCSRLYRAASENKRLLHNEY